LAGVSGWNIEVIPKNARKAFRLQQFVKVSGKQRLLRTGYRQRASCRLVHRPVSHYLHFMVKLAGLMPLIWAIAVAVARLAELWMMMRDARDWRSRPSSPMPKEPVPSHVAPSKAGTNRRYAAGRAGRYALASAASLKR